jgi:folate-binding protein YgfZ
MENPILFTPIETPLLGLHVSANAEMGEYFGTLLPARFSDFGSEYRALRRAVALVDSNFRALFSLSGPDRQRYLNAILTSNVRDLKAGEGTVGLLLTPQGHILAEVETLALPDRILAFSHAMVRDRTFSTLGKFIIMDDVNLEDLTLSGGTLDLLGPRATEVISELAKVDIAAMPEAAHVEARIGSTSSRIIRHTWVGHPAATVVVAREQLGPLWQELARRVRAIGGVPAGIEALNSIRLEYGIAWFGQDYDDKNIPHETGLELSHISYAKGCYTGQEIVERVRSRGHANRRLTGLRFLDGNAPAVGTKLFVPGDRAPNEAGHVTSAGFSPLVGRRIGLGYVRREHSALGTRLDASGTTADVIALPLVEKQSLV